MEKIIFFGVIIFIAYMIYSSNKKRAAAAAYFSQREKISKSESEVTKNNEGACKLLYKTKGIQSFDMVGMYYRNLSINEKGKFNGYAICDGNPHDKYAVAIYNDKGTHLGYIPQHNKRMHDSIVEWNAGKIFVWGELIAGEYKNELSWHGSVNFPIGYSEEVIAQLKELLTLLRQNEDSLDKQDISMNEYFSILNNYRIIRQIYSSIENIIPIEITYPKSLIPTLARRLEAEKNWEQLAMLEEYSDLISLSAETFAKSTFKRIEIAKNNQ